MAVSFPANPSEGDLYQNPATGAYYQYTDDSWSVICFEDVEECDPSGTWPNEGETTTDSAPSYGFYWRYFDVDGTAPANTTMLYLGSNTRLHVNDFPDPDNLPNRIVLNGQTFVIRNFVPFGGGIIGDVQLYGDQRAFFQDAANDDVNYKFCTVDPAEDDSHPYVGKYRVVHPDDFASEDGTVALTTPEYDAGDRDANFNNPMSGQITKMEFGTYDLNGFGFGIQKGSQQGDPYGYLTFDIQNAKPDPRDSEMFPFVSYTTTNQVGRFSWEVFTTRLGQYHYFQEGDILYIRNPSREQTANTNYVDYHVNNLQNEIIELEEEIEAIAPSVERGIWKFTLTGDVNDNGDITFYDDTFGNGNPTGLFTAVKSIWLNSEDNGGTPHGFTNVEVGHLIEVFVQGESDFGLYTVTEIHDQSSGPVSYWAFDVEFVRALDNPTSAAAPGDLIRVKTFQAPTGGDASEFVLKSGDKMSGKLEFAPNETADSLFSVVTNENTYQEDITIAAENYIYMPIKRRLNLVSEDPVNNPDNKISFEIGQSGNNSGYCGIQLKYNNDNYFALIKAYYRGLVFETAGLAEIKGSEGVQVRGDANSDNNYFKSVNNTNIFEWGEDGTYTYVNFYILSPDGSHIFKTFADGPSAADCVARYYGEIEDDNDIVNKKYVDENSGGVEVRQGPPDAPIPLGKMWFDTNLNALYLKTGS